jgi:hypothetical protein
VSGIWAKLQPAAEKVGTFRLESTSSVRAAISPSIADESWDSACFLLDQEVFCYQNNFSLRRIIARDNNNNPRQNNR